MGATSSTCRPSDPRCCGGAAEGSIQQTGALADQLLQQEMHDELPTLLRSDISCAEESKRRNACGQKAATKAAEAQASKSAEAAKIDNNRDDGQNAEGVSAKPQRSKSKATSQIAKKAEAESLSAAEWTSARLEQRYQEAEIKAAKAAEAQASKSAEAAKVDKDRNVEQNAEGISEKPQRSKSKATSQIAKKAQAESLKAAQWTSARLGSKDINVDQPEADVKAAKAQAPKTAEAATAQKTIHKPLIPKFRASSASKVNNDRNVEQNAEGASTKPQRSKSKATSQIAKKATPTVQQHGCEADDRSSTKAAPLGKPQLQRSGSRDYDDWHSPYISTVYVHPCGESAIVTEPKTPATDECQVACVARSPSFYDNVINAETLWIEPA